MMIVFYAGNVFEPVFCPSMCTAICCSKTRPEVWHPRNSLQQPESRDWPVVKDDIQNPAQDIVGNLFQQAKHRCDPNSTLIDQFKSYNFIGNVFTGTSHLIKQLNVERFSSCLCLVTVPSSSIMT